MGEQINAGALSHAGQKCAQVGVASVPCTSKRPSYCSTRKPMDCSASAKVVEAIVEMIEGDLQKVRDDDTSNRRDEAIGPMPAGQRGA